MKVDRRLFEEKGLKCDRYADFIDSLDKDFSKGNHHVYPKSVFLDNRELISLTPEDHTRAHLYLAEDNLDLERTKEVIQILGGIVTRYSMGYVKNKDNPDRWTWYLEDLEYFHKNFPENFISEISSGLSKILWSDPVKKEEHKLLYRKGWDNESLRKWKSQQMRECYSKPEMKVKLSKAAKDRMTPEVKQKIKDTKNRPEYIKRRHMLRCFHILKETPSRGVSIQDVIYQREWKDKEYKGMMFHYFSYFLKELGMTDNTIKWYQSKFEKPEFPYSEELEVHRWIDPTDYELMSNFVKSLNID